VNRSWAALLLVVLASLGGVAAAQVGWTVQTVAVRDLREANTEVERLRGLGLAAYTEFTMLDGLQFVRVRVGCFDRETAERWAGLLQGAITREAVAMPLSGALPEGVPCVMADVGFRKPASWSLVSGAGDQPTFRVEVAGFPAYLRYDGSGWRLWQAVAPAPEPIGAIAFEASVRVGSVAGQPIVRDLLWGALCPGRLLASIGDVGIADQGDAIVACRVVPAP
jgi:hypothetical protein